MPRNLIVETFVRIESWVLISIAFFWLEIIIYEVLLMLRESLLALSQLSTPTSSLFTVAWTLLMSLLDAKTCTISKMNKTHLIWGCIHVIDIQKKEYWAQHRTLWNTLCNVSHWGIAVFDWDVLFLVTQIRLKPVLHDTSDTIMQKLTHQYVKINCVKCFWEIWIYSNGERLCVWRLWCQCT